VRVLLLAAATALAASAQTPPPLPDGEGKKVVEKLCLDCHGPENFTSKKRTKDEWEKVVSDMIEKGAQGTESELDQVVAYLTKYFGKAQSARSVRFARVH
jgi:cytochrome c5